MKRASRFAVGAAIVGVATALAVFWPGAAGTDPSEPGNRVIAHALDVALGNVQPAPHEQPVSGGLLQAALEASGHIDAVADTQSGGEGAHASGPGKTGTLGCQNRFSNGTVNVRVNQDCSLRRQAEETIAINPTNENNLVAGQNDSRIGFNHCGYDWSFDGGKTWGDQLPPFWQFQGLDGHTFDACSDPTATFDARGNAYVGGIVFDITSAASAFIVMKSNAGIGGAFYHTPAPLSFQTYRDTPLGVVANDNDPNIAHDKEFIVADANAHSPKVNNVYATWTRFNFDTKAGVGVDSPIYFSQSLNGGATWSPGIEISGAAAVCTGFSGQANPNACDQDQGSDPIVGPDGTIYVSFFNGNTPLLGVNQHLLVKCPAANDCSNPASWLGPYKIQDDFDNQPVGPNAATGCPGGRQCLPPNGYRIQDETYGSISGDDHGTLYHVFSDFRNGGPPCTGSAATATPPCDQDVLYSFSTDGGVTWSKAVNLTPASKFGKSAQWQPWNDVTNDGSALYAAYYDRSYGHCETEGCNDITLARVGNPASNSPDISYKRITTSSMPNLVVANNPVQAGFLGDYMWVAVDSQGRPHVVWADTRGLNNTIEEDIYFYRPGL